MTSTRTSLETPRVAPSVATLHGRTWSRVEDHDDVRPGTQPVPPKPAPAPAAPGAPAPAPAPAPPAKAPAAATAVTLPDHVRGAHSPAGTPDRIPPRIDTPVDVDVQNAKAPVTLAIEGIGGGNGGARIDGSMTTTVSKSQTVQLRGTTQTDPGSAGKLHLVARQGPVELARTAGFSVAAWPVAMGFTFGGLMSPLVLDGDPLWGAFYDLAITSDSGVTADLSRSKVSEIVVRDGAGGLWEHAVDQPSGFLAADGGQRDHHGTSRPNAAALIAAIDAAGAPAKSHIEHNQFFRFSCERTGITEDAAAAPKVETSGFRIEKKASITGTKYFIEVKKRPFTNHGVAAGTVDDGTLKRAEVKD